MVEVEKVFFNYIIFILGLIQALTDLNSLPWNLWCKYDSIANGYLYIADCILNKVTFIDSALNSIQFDFKNEFSSFNT